LADSPEGDLRWIADEELESLPLWPSDHIFLPWLKAEKFFSAKFVYAGETYLSYEVKFHP
jgi:8-oxo-dGTP diphosphatase